MNFHSLELGVPCQDQVESPNTQSLVSCSCRIEPCSAPWQRAGTPRHEPRLPWIRPEPDSPPLSKLHYISYVWFPSPSKVFLYKRSSDLQLEPNHWISQFFHISPECPTTRSSNPILGPPLFALLAPDLPVALATTTCRGQTSNGADRVILVQYCKTARKTRGRSYQRDKQSKLSQGDEGA